jgi:hypothetical protein
MLASTYSIRLLNSLSECDSDHVSQHRGPLTVSASWGSMRWGTPLALTLLMWCWATAGRVEGSRSGSMPLSTSTRRDSNLQPMSTRVFVAPSEYNLDTDCCVLHDQRCIANAAPQWYHQSSGDGQSILLAHRATVHSTALPLMHHSLLAGRMPSEVFLDGRGSR